MSRTAPIVTNGPTQPSDKITAGSDRRSIRLVVAAGIATLRFVFSALTTSVRCRFGSGRQSPLQPGWAVSPGAGSKEGHRDSDGKREARELELTGEDMRTVRDCNIRAEPGGVDRPVLAAT